jgi:hypothetical protein
MNPFSEIQPSESNSVYSPYPRPIQILKALSRQKFYQNATNVLLIVFFPAV